MEKSLCCKKKVKKGPWTPEEDQKLISYIKEHGHGSWRTLPMKAGLHRCGKSCRLRWINYLNPDIKRGKFSAQEEQSIIQLHALLGNRWSIIAAQLPKRTDNEIKNYWNTHLKKRLTKMGVDPVTHKPKTNARLSHMAQWESVRLEAETRLVREYQASNNSNPNQRQSKLRSKANAITPTKTRPPCIDVLKAWQVIVSDMSNFVTPDNVCESPAASRVNFCDDVSPISAVNHPLALLHHQDSLTSAVYSFDEQNLVLAGECFEYYQQNVGDGKNIWNVTANSSSPIF